MKRRVLCLFCGFIFLWTGIAFSNPSNTGISGLIQDKLPTSNVGVIVLDAQTGNVLYQHNAAQAFTPASNVKLLTATAALDILGPDYTITTALLESGNNVYLSMHGDPSFTVYDLENLIAALKAKNITAIQGNFVIDDSYFGVPWVAPGWSQDDLPRFYAAPITASVINENQLFVRISASQNLNVRPVISWVHPQITLPIRNMVSTVPNGSYPHSCELLPNMDQTNTANFSGCWPAQGNSVEIISLANSTLYVEKLVAKLLRENNIRLNGKVVVGITPANAEILVTHQSEPLKSLIKTMLKKSDNIYAECILKTLGKVQYGKGTFKSGVLAVKAVLQKLAHINPQTIVLADGSGNSRYDLINPTQLANLLFAVYHTPALKDILIPALPEGGVDGTLAWRMQSGNLKGKVFAKTGSMGGVSNLSGFLLNKNRPLIFSIMINHIIGQLDATHTLEHAEYVQDEIIAMIQRNLA